MLDFLLVSTRATKRGTVEIYPKFMIRRSSDLMIRGGDFYAIWCEDKGLWSTDEQDAVQLIDRELDMFAQENKAKFDSDVKIMHMWDAETGMIDRWHKYCQTQCRDSFVMLDEKLVFANSPTNKKDYASKRLPYPLEECDTPAWETIISTLYSEEERHKIEWAIGSIVSGDSRDIQKFMVMYGAAGTGKSTILNIVQQLFDGYYSVFDARALGSTSNAFALESFKTNPLVAIQHDGDLSHIEDNTRLNSLVSHELMTVNEKFRSAYSNRFKAFLFMGTNKPVKITDAKSGLIRRLIDVTPTGNKLSRAEYNKAIKQVSFELGGIAYRCLGVYLANPGAYDNYIPINMMGASNDFYNFMLDSYFKFKKSDGVTLKVAWEMYKVYCEEARVAYPFSQRVFKEELKSYFKNYDERLTLSNGDRVRSFYSGFLTDKFETQQEEEAPAEPEAKLIEFQEQPSIFDETCSGCFAQYASSKETPTKKWENVTSKLGALDTTRLHYVKVPENHIVIDFDIPDANGNKCFELNLKEASKWPPTYAELSKSGQGIHLHYIYTGDPSRLSRIYDDKIEVKVFTGNSSLRRKLTKCNNLPIATISSGLPLKGDDKVLNPQQIKSERVLRTMILRNIEKEIHPGTKPSIDFIKKILDDAYASDLKYDVRDLHGAITAFAAHSTHQADYCLKLVSQMKFKSEENSENFDGGPDELVFFDVEVFPNLFLISWKFQGEGKSVNHIFNPKPEDIEQLTKFKLVGFNNRRYDNHMIYACMIGYTPMQIYQLSQSVINSKSRDCLFGEAYNLSYTDIYDFAAKKQSLKKWEIELGIHHHELGLPWDQPVPEERWEEVASYCDDDVRATEATFDACHADFVAREILADVAGMTVNDTTNSLTTKIIFGSNKNPQSQFNYRNLAKPVPESEYESYREKFGDDYEFHVFDDKGNPTYETYDPEIPFALDKGYSIMPYFPGYEYKYGKSMYRGIDPKEGGFVWATWGIHYLVALLDIASMHPSSIEVERLFGPEFTKRFMEIKQCRLYIKHKEFDKAKKLLNGALAKYLDDEKIAKQLSQALKIVINSVYGLTSAGFKNAFRDERNQDNIVAKRGALFMINLLHEVEKRGFTVAHIKTDSIKIPNATPEIIKFVVDYGKEFGYNFEHEATYEKMCLVNNAVYIAKFASLDTCYRLYGEDYVNSSKDTCAENKEHGGEWTATGTQFQVPYVFKTLFSKEPIEFNDLCETKSVTSALYLDMNENLPDVSAMEKELDKMKKAYPDFDTAPKSQEVQAIEKRIAEGHDYHFVGRVGQFCPIKDGCGGGLLMRQTDNGYANATGAKGYRWMESEMVRDLNKSDDIDRDYYRALVDDAVEAVNQYGDFEQFISDDAVDISVAPWFAPDDANAHPFNVR